MQRMLVLSVAALTTLAACGRAHQAARSTATTRASAPLHGDTPFGMADLSADERTLEINVGSEPAGDGPCQQRFTYQVDETPTSVTVAFSRATNASTPTTAPTPCPGSLTSQHFTVPLAAPLADRLLYDGVEPRPKQVWRLGDIVHLRFLPDGVTANDLDRMPSREPHEWTLSAQVSSGPGWDLLIDQGPAGSFIAPTSTAPGKVVATTMIHGQTAQMWEYFNYTGHALHWTEAGVDISVRAELHTVHMATPHSFANPQVAFIDGVLERIANGITVPPQHP